MSIKNKLVALAALSTLSMMDDSAPKVYAGNRNQSKSPLTKKQKKARMKAKAARKARRKNR